MDAEYGPPLIAEGLAVAEGLGLGEDAEGNARGRGPASSGIGASSAESAVS